VRWEVRKQCASAARPRTIPGNPHAVEVHAVGLRILPALSLGAGDPSSSATVFPYTLPGPGVGSCPPVPHGMFSWYRVPVRNAGWFLHQRSNYGCACPCPCPQRIARRPMRTGTARFPWEPEGKPKAGRPGTRLRGHRATWQGVLHYAACGNTQAGSVEEEVLKVTLEDGLTG